MTARPGFVQTGDVAILEQVMEQQTRPGTSAGRGRQLARALVLERQHFSRGAASLTNYCLGLKQQRQQQAAPPFRDALLGWHETWRSLAGGRDRCGGLG